MNGIAGLAGWRWIFVNKSFSLDQLWPIPDYHRHVCLLFQILEGIATVIIGLVAACILPEDLEKATFFTEEERVFAGDWIFKLEHPSGLKKLPSSVKRFQLDNSRISNARLETGTKDEKDVVNVADADFSSYLEDEKFEWREIIRGWIITPMYHFYELTLVF